MSDLIDRLNRVGSRVGLTHRTKDTATGAEAALYIGQLEAALNADDQTLRLALGELFPQDMRNIRAAFRWALGQGKRE